MQIHRGIDNLPNFQNAVVTIGSFDGVHVGHRQLLSRIKILAHECNGVDVVVTFDPHPRSIVFPGDNSLKLLNTLEEKIKLLSDAGVSHLVIVPFTVSFSQQSAAEYIEKFIIGCFSPAYLVIGYDHRFGLNRLGNYDLLKMYEANGAFKLLQIEKQEVEEIAVSSTKVRNLLLKGDVEGATKLLGQPFILSGKVERGDNIGTSIGFPTANIKLDLPSKLVPDVGVYSVMVHHESYEYGGMLYIGHRPTLNEKLDLKIEVNIFDFNENIYNQNISIDLISKIRDDIKFENLEGLKSQLSKDKVQAQKILSYKPTFLKPEVAIVILNYNGKTMLQRYLQTVKGSSSNPLDIVVIDNASTDDSVSYIESQYPDIQIIKLSRNYGFAEGYNQGLQHIDYEYFVLLNSDVRCTKNWLDPLIVCMKANDQIGAVMPKILSEAKPDHFEYAGAAGGYIDSLGYPYCRGRIFDTIELDQGQYDEAIEVDWVTGAAMVIRAELYRSLGGFDKDYFAHMEEIDLCIRLKQMGYLSYVLPTSTVYHVGGGTLHYNSPRKTFLNFRNNLITVTKNWPVSQLLWVIPARLLLDGVAGIKYLLAGQWKNTLAIVQAHFAYYGSILVTIKKRKHINRTHEINFKPVSILFSYFLLQKRKYSDIIKDNLSK